MDETVEQRAKKLGQFKQSLQDYQKNRDDKTRQWLNQNMGWVKREVAAAGCMRTLTAAPPPAVGGIIMPNIDVFDMMFQNVYGRSLVPFAIDMIDCTIGELQNPITSRSDLPTAAGVEPFQKGYAFIAMPIDPQDHQLVDVLEAIKEAANTCGITAERVDDVQSSERITDRILESIAKAEFVFVDLTKERPNVFFEAGYAHGLKKTPIYIARHGTTLHFDIKDYPVIMFHNMRELKDGIKARLQALTKSRERPV